MVGRVSADNLVGACRQELACPVVAHVSAHARLCGWWGTERPARSARGRRQRTRSTGRSMLRRRFVCYSTALTCGLSCPCRAVPLRQERPPTDFLHWPQVARGPLRPTRATSLLGEVKPGRNSAIVGANLVKEPPRGDSALARSAYSFKRDNGSENLSKRSTWFLAIVPAPATMRTISDLPSSDHEELCRLPIGDEFRPQQLHPLKSIIRLSVADRQEVAGPATALAHGAVLLFVGQRVGCDAQHQNRSSRRTPQPLKQYRTTPYRSAQGRPPVATDVLARAWARSTPLGYRPSPVGFGAGASPAGGTFITLSVASTWASATPRPLTVPGCPGAPAGRSI